MRRARAIFAGGAPGATIAAVLLVSSELFAFHTEDERITDHSAYTMKAESFRIGLFRMDYGVWDAFTARTYTLPWVLRVPNLHFKWRIYGRDPWAVALDTGFFAFDTRSLESVDDDVGRARIVALPIELSGSYRFDETHTLSTSVVYTALNVEGEINDESLNGAGEGAVENGQWTVTYEARFDDTFALQLLSRWVLFQRFQAGGNAVFMPDEYTTVEIVGGARGEQGELAGAGSVALDAVYSFKRTNLRLGVGYGHYNIPGINFVVPQAGFFPSFDLYWVFRRP